MKKYKNISSIGVILIIVIISISSLITTDKEISELEARKLQLMPTINNLVNKEKTHNFNAYIYEVLTGALFTKWENYFSDHIYLRNKMVDTYTFIQSKLNKKYINDVYLGSDGYFLSNTNPKGITDNKLKEIGEYFNSIAEEFDKSKIYMVNLPHKSTVYENNMPIKDYKSLSRVYINKLWSNIDKDKIEIIDIDNIFNNEYDLFYKTDHHWNMNGAWKAYEYIIDELSKEFIEIHQAKTKDFYNIETYEECFIGSDGRRVKQFVRKMDNIEVYRHKNIDDYKVWINDDEGEFFYESNLKKDMFSGYGIYLNGDNAEVVIENAKSINDLSIVVIGDSMDNKLIPLLAPHFYKIYSYDLRLYKEDLNNTIKNINPDIIMFNGLTNHYIDSELKIFNINNN